MGNLLNTCVPPPPSRDPKTISQQYNASHCAASSQEVNLSLTISTISHQEDISPHRHESACDNVEENTVASPEPEPETQPDAQHAAEPESQLQTQSQTQAEQGQEHQAGPEPDSQQLKDIVATRPVLKPAVAGVSKHRISPPTYYLTGLPDHEARWKVDRSVFK